MTIGKFKKFKPWQPRIYMIQIMGNRSSEYYSNITIESWNKFGYTITPVQGVTPATLHEYTDIQFPPRKGRNGREFTETEKCVFYSHIMLWRKVANQGTAIILEDDAKMFRPLALDTDPVWQRLYQPLCSFGDTFTGAITPSPSGGYYLQPQGARDLINLVKKNQHIRGGVQHNNDYYQDLYWCLNYGGIDRPNQMGSDECREKWFADNYKYLVAAQYKDDNYPKTVSHGKVKKQ